MSTRAVSAAAGVQPPAIYRQFGDMRGLLNVVASHGFASYVASKAALAPTDDPVDGLRRGWDLHVGFGLANPAIYTVIFGEPRPGAQPDAAAEADAILRGLVERVAVAGRLRVGVERAADMIHAAGSGLTLVLIGMQPEHRDPGLSAAVREAVLDAITISEAAGVSSNCGASRAAVRAVALKAVLDECDGVFAPAELGLLALWLDRIAAGGTTPDDRRRD